MVDNMSNRSWGPAGCESKDLWCLEGESTVFFCCSRTRDWLGTLVKKGREIKTSWGQLGCVLFNIFWAVIGILNIITIIICFTNIWSTFQVVVTLLAYFLFCRWVLVLFFSPNRLHLLVYLFYRSNISRSYLQIWKYSSLTYYIKV